MYNLAKSTLIIIFILILQLSIYSLFLKPIVTTWGASKQEVSMPMEGDTKDSLITSTRAILINAPQHTAWKWLMQLGADRAGFYSYAFIERVLGYETRYPDLTKPSFKNLSVGDVVRGSIDEPGSIVLYNFRVLYVQPEDAFVLQNWGTFLLEKINNQQTRLVIRTQEMRSPSLFIRFSHYLFVPFHFIMERRMLIGIKMHAEEKSDVNFSQNKDLLWFFGLVTSWFLICFLVFIGRGFVQSVFIPAIFSVFWLLSVLLFNPTPFYSVILLLILCLVAISMVLTRIKKPNDEC